MFWKFVFRISKNENIGKAGALKLKVFLEWLTIVLICLEFASQFSAKYWPKSATEWPKLSVGYCSVANYLHFLLINGCSIDGILIGSLMAEFMFSSVNLRPAGCKLFSQGANRSIIF